MGCVDVHLPLVLIIGAPSAGQQILGGLQIGATGRRQTVLLDLSRMSADDLEFPVLLPLLDIPNHSPEAKIDLMFDPGLSGIVTRGTTEAGHEVFNNYGPKGNDELLLGYGFCIPGNPDDKVLLTLKPPPMILLESLRQYQLGYFSREGEWKSEKATFGLHRLPYDPRRPSALFERLPEALLELMVYLIRHERGLSFAFLERPLQHLMSERGQHYLPFVARMIVQSLAPKLAQLHASTPATDPSTPKQRQAKIYRDGQCEILQSVTGSLREYLRSLLYTPDSARNRGLQLVILEELLELLNEKDSDAATAFLQGIEVNAGTSDVAQLRQAGWEEDVFVLLLCFVHLSSSMKLALPEYVASTSSASSGNLSDHTEEELDQSRSLLDLVQRAAEAYPGTLWSDERWDKRFIACVRWSDAAA